MAQTMEQLKAQLATVREALSNAVRVMEATRQSKHFLLLSGAIQIGRDALSCDGGATGELISAALDLIARSPEEGDDYGAVVYFRLADWQRYSRAVDGYWEDHAKRIQNRQLGD